MNCTNCGATVIQGPNGGWSCGNCGASGVVPAPIEMYFETYTCTGCGEQVDGVGGRWACTACGATSGYVEPPEGWQSELSEHVGRRGYVGSA
jgi:ribosomal protein L37AE/L43A